MRCHLPWAEVGAEIESHAGRLRREAGVREHLNVNRKLWMAFEPSGISAQGSWWRLGSAAAGRFSSGGLSPSPRSATSSSRLAMGDQIKEAVSQLSRWHERGFPLKVSVNHSAVQVHRHDVFGIVTDFGTGYSRCPRPSQTVVAEGGDPGKNEFLRIYCCDYAQGFVLARRSRRRTSTGS